MEIVNNIVVPVGTVGKCFRSTHEIIGKPVIGFAMLSVAGVEKVFHSAVIHHA